MTRSLLLLAVGLLLTVTALCGPARASEASDALRTLCSPSAVRFARIVTREAERASVDPVLVVAVIRAESTCNPNADSGSGDIGLGQVRLGTLAAAGATRAQLLDPEVNINRTATWLSRCLATCPTLLGGLSLYRGVKGCKDTKGSRRVVGLWEFAKRKRQEQRRS